MLTKKQRELLLFIHRRIQEEEVSPSFDEMKDALNLKSKSGIHRLITALEERKFIRRLPNRARALEIIRLPSGHKDHTYSGQSNNDTNAQSPKHAPLMENMPALVRRGFGSSITTSAAVSPVGLGSVNSAFDASEQPKRIDKSLDSSTLSHKSEVYPQMDHGVDNVHLPVMGRIAAGIPISAIEYQTHSIALPANMVGLGEHFALEVEGDSMIEAGIHNGDTVIIRKTSSATTGDIIVAFIDNEEATLKRLRLQGNSIILEAANPAFEPRTFDRHRIQVQGCLAGLMRWY